MMKNPKTSTGRFGTRIRLATAVATLGAAALLGASTPASAASQLIGTSGHEARCNTSPYLVCYYYNSSWSSAYWGTASSVSTISSKFLSGTGTGAGKVVRNDAHLMACDYAPSYCDSWVSPGFQGSDDWELSGYVGTLYYTLNNEASIQIV